MIEGIKVKDVMTKKLLTLHPKDKISKASDLFNQYRIHHIPILVMNEVVGIISQGDVLKISKRIHSIISNYKDRGNFSLQVIEDIMTTNPITINSNEELIVGINSMLKNRINALPVVDEDQLVGLITTFDILKYLTKTK